VTNNTSRGPSAADAVAAAAPSPKLISLPAVLERVPLCKARVYQLIATGEFPRPVKIGKRSTWLEHEVAAWIVALAARRDAAV
jgi:prophage regulatory protein